MFNKTTQKASTTKPTPIIQRIMQHHQKSITIKQSSRFTSSTIFSKTFEKNKHVHKTNDPTNN
jgi:hypothetical protein